MKAREELLLLLGTGPKSFSELRESLQYSKGHLSNELSTLEQEGLVRKIRRGKNLLLTLEDNYDAHKLGELYMAAVTHGIDPARLEADCFRKAWLHLKNSGESTLREVASSSGCSYSTTYSIITDMLKRGLAEKTRGKPLTVRLTLHEVNRLLANLWIQEGLNIVSSYTSGYPLMRTVWGTPGAIEEKLFKKARGLVVEGVRLRRKVEEPLEFVIPIEGKVDAEEVFLREIQTPNGVEETCIHLITEGKVRYDELLRRASERGLVNVVGCYLDILRSIHTDLIPRETVETFQRQVDTSHVPQFLAEEAKYGKEGWEAEFEGKWSVDLYLDLRGIRHGIRSVT
ncbi:MAG: helix-turn-helix domain-containing protein [Candidatus Geothermarchaeales archaeon]